MSYRPIFPQLTHEQAYISGNIVVIFNGRREILQSISVDDAESLHCLTIREDNGHIAVSDADTVYLYQPFGRDYGDLRWTRTSTLPHETEDAIHCLSWGADDELLVAGHRLTLWNLSDEQKPQVIWASYASSPIFMACFSPDAGLIASCGQHDRLVKIWRRLSYEQDSTRFDVSYLLHPSTVTNLSWRSFWHQEQNLDNLLYTFCADNHVRVWAHSEQHAYNIMQQIIDIDTSVSIQPRRLSVGSVSDNRFAFMLESRDLARAAERSLQTYRNGKDHALENFIQIANRSPEVCVILDGRGHMSAWAIENAALRNKQDPDKSNVALVDGVDISLPSGRSLDDHVQIRAFANNDASASLCILVHSYSGQIDWYQGTFVEFFDTAARTRRTNLLSCWSGHDSPLEKMISSYDGQSFISLDEQEHAILWCKSMIGALVRQSRMRSDEPILDATILGNTNLVVLLHDKKLSVWDTRAMNAREIGGCELDASEPVAIQHINRTEQNSQEIEVAVLFEDSKLKMYSISSPDLTRSRANEYHRSAGRTSAIGKLDIAKDDAVIFSLASQQRQHNNTVVSLSDAGLFKIFEISRSDLGESLNPSASLVTNVRASNIVASFDGTLHTFAHEDYRTISIWNSAQGVCEYVRTFQDLDLIHELHWHLTADGQLVLAIQFPYNVVVLGQQRYRLSDRKSTWELLQIVRTRRHSTVPINSLCWLQSCQLVLGSGSQILTFDVQKEPDVSDAGTRESVRDIEAQQYLALTNASLPAFNPELLGCLLESGYFSTISSIFHALNAELKFLVQGEKIDHSLGRLSMATTFSNANPSNQPASDLSDIQPQFSENIVRMSTTQLPLEQQRRLQQLTQIYLQLIENQRSMDSHALAYLYHFLSTMSQTTSAVVELSPLPLSAIVHASLSQTQESLTYFILLHLEQHDIKFTWANARSLGVFLFTSDVEALKLHLESVAKAEYNRNPDERNPVDCSLYYLALDKKAILQSLWRRTVGVKEKENTLKLLARDFKDPKAKATALKNAYALLSRRRFEYAAAFFLLGGSLSDAVNVCVNQLHDIQLAIAITRVWNGNVLDQASAMKKLIEKDIPEMAIDSHEGRWLKIWGDVHRQDMPGAIRSVIQPIDHLFESQFRGRRAAEGDGEKKQNIHFAAYDYRVNEPGLLITLYTQLRANLSKQGQWSKEVLFPREEWNFVMRCVDWYTRAGMDLIALRLVTHWQFVDWQEPAKSKDVGQKSSSTGQERSQRSALDDWLMPDGNGDSADDNAATGTTKAETKEEPVKAKPPPTQFYEPSADSLLDSFGF